MYPFYLHRVGVVIALSPVSISKVTFELRPQLFFEFFLNQIKTFNFKTFNGFKSKVYVLSKSTPYLLDSLLRNSTEMHENCLIVKLY